MCPPNDNSLQSDSQAEWCPCPAGAISMAAGNGPERYDRREVFFKAGGIAAVVVSGLMLRRSILDTIVPIPEVEYAMSCAEVHQQLDAFIAETVPPDLVLNVSRHLVACSHCMQSYKVRGGDQGYVNRHAT